MFGQPQLAMKKARSFGRKLEQAFAMSCGAGVALFLGHLHTDLGGLKADGVGELEPFGAHDEAKHAASGAAPEAIKHLFIGGNAKGR